LIIYSFFIPKSKENNYLLLLFFIIYEILYVHENFGNKNQLIKKPYKMKKNIFILMLFSLIFHFSIFSQKNEKIPLDHSVYDTWKDLKNAKISNNAEWISYEINPQKGDGNLYVYNLNTSKFDSIPRAYDAEISSNSSFIAFKIKPQILTTRKAKLDKVKKEKMPKDSIGILVFGSDTIIKYENLISYKLPEKNSNWFAFLLKKKKVENDSISNDTLSKKNKEGKSKKDKVKKGDLFVINPISNKEYTFKNVEDYFISKNGKLIGIITSTNDSIDSTRVVVFNTEKTFTKQILSKAGTSKNIIIDDEGKQLSFIYSADTCESKAYSLFYYDENSDNTRVIADSLNAAMPKNYSISPFKKMFFSDNGKRLYFGTAPKPLPEPKDTLTEDEKCSVDIWNWKDKLLQPHQLKRLEKEKKISFQAVYFPKTGLMTQLGDTLIRNVVINKKNEGEFALGIDDQPYWKNQSWESSHKKDIYLINQKTGEKQLISKAKQSTVTLSPDEKYIVWYESVDSSWKAYSIKEKEFVCLTKNIDVNFYNEKHDMPFLPGSYGIGGWTKNDKYIFINDRFDIWKVDPSGKLKAENITKGFGRENDIRFRIIKLDKEALCVDENNILLSAFNENTKQSGFFRTKINSKENPQLLIFEDYSFIRPQKAKNSDKIIWNKSTFIEYPELWVSDLNFRDAKKISNTNPQQEKYLWGTNELVEWTSFDGNHLRGILYKPENFDPSKKYPMITYFYERSSDRLNRHLIPKPSRSVINFPLYTSNGYIIFVPDIIYKNGLPGKSAYNAIHSGVMKLCEKSFIDKNNIGLQGQSWGGYQVAYLVTQTNFYKAAMAGAPVSNMTSAYGGIRWGSGMSRMFQYEESQSRIGGTLWDKTNLYIENSPVFYADRIETPLLIMHNDNDGAVPWYQGIELFVALRRLNKPVWMLTYNGAPHNLSRRADCEDLSIRMLQFFDHYLKNAPIPVWMEKGIPAIEKGKNKGYEFVK